MKRFYFILIFILAVKFVSAQVAYNPNVAIRPIANLSVYKVEMTDSTTAVTFRIVNKDQLPPFSLKSKDIILRKVSDTMNLPLLRWENAKFSPDRHIFSHRDEVYDFTLHFGGLIKPVKYIDVIEQTPEKDFYVQGIIIDEELNRGITRGFRAAQLGDTNGALEHFINVAEMDLYFEYGLAYFNIIYILSQQNRWAEAREWYGKYKDKFFYDKQLLTNSLDQLGLLQKLEGGN